MPKMELGFRLQGTELFDALRAHFGDELPFFAEDLGIITEDVEKLRIDNNLMGMKALAVCVHRR